MPKPPGAAWRAQPATRRGSWTTQLDRCSINKSGKMIRPWFRQAAVPWKTTAHPDKSIWGESSLHQTGVLHSGRVDGLQVLIDECWRGRRWVVETDIASCFSAIPHEKLMEAVEERVCDQSVLKLLRAMLRAGVMEDGRVQRTVAGTPQGGVVSPVMCNVYLHRLDRAWDDGEGVLVRFADDLVVMCWSRSQAEQALERLTELLAGLGLEPKAAKTRIVHLAEGGEGFDFLGFHHRLVRSRGRNGKKPVAFLARWPADKAMQHARDRIRELTRRSRLLLAPEWIVEDLNQFLRGLGRLFPVR